VTSDAERTRVRLEEVRDDIRALEAALPEPLTLEPAFQEITATLEAYESLERGDLAAQGGDR
jgi:hypothetical protein